MRKKYFPPFTRNCPKCECELVYTNAKNRNRAGRLKKLCRSCSSKEVNSRPEIKEIRRESAKKQASMRKFVSTKALPPFIRKCPKCERELTYTTVKSRNRSEKLKKICRSCRAKEVHSRPYIKKMVSEKFKKKFGSENSFFGRHHTKETIEKLRKVDRSYTQTEDFRKKSARHGSKNGMYKRNFYDIWKEKYGVEEASKKYAEWIKVQSKNSSGKNNPMYDKPSPRGSGGGWGGWYKGWYFRSLRELSYMINVIEAQKYTWESAECNKFAIPYINYDGVSRTYHPDFLINGRILVEIKPKRLMETPTNVLKKEAAISFCKKNNLEYQITDIRIIETEKLIELFQDGIIKFNKKYQIRMEKICELAKSKK